MKDSLPGSAPKQLSWSEVMILYRREMRSALREKSIVLSSILVPIFLFPFLLWAAFTAVLFVSGQSDAAKARVGVIEWPADPLLRRAFERDEQVELHRGAADRAALEAKVRGGELDALVEFTPAEGKEAAVTNNFRARIVFDGARDRSVDARNRVESIIDRYRSDRLKREGRRLGISPAGWQGYTLSYSNIASEKQMGAFTLGLIIPVIFVVMVAVGCFYPAVDSIAGERERNTWETLMSSGAGRLSIVLAKYFYVASFGGLAGIMNLLAMLITVKPIFAPLFEASGQNIAFNLPFAALPLVVIAAGLLAGFVAAGMMIFAAFARTFKEGQSMITPFYMVILVPLVFLQVPGLTLSLPLACVPVINLTLMIREAVSGVMNWPAIALALVVSTAVIALCLRFAAFILQFEDVVMGSYGGSLMKFCRQRMLARSTAK